MKYIKKVREFIRKTYVFDLGSISRIVSNRNYTYTLINQMIGKGEINRLAKGFYTAYKDPSLAVYCFKPSYLGLQDAMSFHNLWEQESIPIIITTRKVRNGVRKILETNVMIRRISPSYMFGYDYYDIGGFVLPISDIEKTFIDMIYFREMSKDMIKSFKGNINKEKLKDHLKNYKDRFKKEVFSYLKEIL